MFLTNRRPSYIFNNSSPHPYRFLTNEIRRTRTEFSHKTSQLSHVKVVSFMLEEYAN